MEARLSKQLLHIVELDKAGHLTPEIQHRLSEALDIFHREEQHRAAGGPIGLPGTQSRLGSPTGPGLLGGVTNAGLGKFVNAGPKVRAPRTNFPKLPKPPAIPGVRT
jgi:hypothetical protein